MTTLQKYAIIQIQKRKGTDKNAEDWKDYLPPTCGGTLISTSHFDVESMDNGQIAMSVVGVCDHCGNQYEWVEWYSYIGHNSIQKTEIEARAI